jgi:hypothetical protein
MNEKTECTHNYIKHYVFFGGSLGELVTQREEREGERGSRSEREEMGGG